MSKSAIYKDNFPNFIFNRKPELIGHTVECDSCGRKEQHMDKSYKLINQKLKEDNWIVTNFDGKWVDFCSQECKKSYTKNIRKKVGYI